MQVQVIYNLVAENLSVQTNGIYGTDVCIAIQTVIQTVVIHGTDVGTIPIWGFYI